MSLLKRQSCSFTDSLQETIQYFSASRDMSETIDFRSGAEPDEVDRASLGKFLGLTILPVIETPNGSLMLTLEGRTSSWSLAIGDGVETMSSPPWQVAQAVVDELAKAADLSGNRSQGSLQLVLNGRDVRLDIEKTDSPSGLTVTMTHRN